MQDKKYSTTNQEEILDLVTNALRDTNKFITIQAADLASWIITYLDDSGYTICKTHIPQIRPAFWYMRDNHTFIPIQGEDIEEIKQKAINIAKINPYGMVCPVTIMDGAKEIKRIGKSAHVDKNGDVDLTEWWDEIIKEECVRNYKGVAI